MPWPALPPGGLSRVDRGDRLVWLGVVLGPSGQAAALGRPPNAPGRVRTWPEAWEGPRAQGPWMLTLCPRVARKRLVLAACAVARPALRWAGPGEAEARAALQTAEDLAQGRGGVAGAKAAGDRAYALAAALRQSPTPLGRPELAQQNALRAAGRASQAATYPHEHVHVHIYAEEAASLAAEAAFHGAGEPERDVWRAQAALVRSHIPLGEVLLGRLSSARIEEF